MLKKVVVYTKKGIKFTILSIIAVFLIIGAVAFLYKPTYAVYMENERIGYTENKSKLQHRINDYIEKGDGTKENLAFVQLKENPKYELCLLKKNIVANDDEIFEKAKEGEIPYYRYYAICENEEEKTYVKDFQEAETVVSKLKEKKSKNFENIKIKEKYESEEKELVQVEEAVSKLYVAPSRPVKVASSRSASYNTRGKVNLGIGFVTPVSGYISSPFGNRHGRFHSGLDIATAKGTGIRAISGGTVTKVVYSNVSYGNRLVIDHGNGVQSVYAHCNTINVSQGQRVSQGQMVATVGSTGNSTGPHLHLEIRVNGKACNPQNYLY